MVIAEFQYLKVASNNKAELSLMYSVWQLRSLVCHCVYVLTEEEKVY